MMCKTNKAKDQLFLIRYELVKYIDQDIHYPAEFNRMRRNLACQIFDTIGPMLGQMELTFRRTRDETRETFPTPAEQGKERGELPTPQ